MKIEKNIINDDVEIVLSGRLDTLTSVEFEKEIENLESSNVKNLIINMKDIEYTSSAGLRVLLKAQKIMDSKGTMKLINVNEIVMEVFEITGFNEMLDIE